VDGHRESDGQHRRRLAAILPCCAESPPLRWRRARLPEGWSPSRASNPPRAARPLDIPARASPAPSNIPILPHQDPAPDGFRHRPFKILYEDGAHGQSLFLARPVNPYAAYWRHYRGVLGLAVRRSNGVHKRPQSPLYRTYIALGRQRRIDIAAQVGGQL
jgi:hypothetical protein